MLTILMGRAKTGKSEYLLRQIAQAGDGGRQLLIVPEHASHAAEVDLCRACGDTVSRHAEVLSFRRLAARVLTITGGLSDVTLDAGGKLLTLQRALNEVSPVLKLYRRPSRRAAFLEKLLALFDELQSYAVTPEALAEQAAAIPGATGEKLSDLSLLYGAYEARLCRPGHDARDRMEKLCERLEESGFADGADVYLDGFTYFNARESRVLSILMRRARSVTVTLLGEENGGRSELFTASYRTRDALARLAADAGCESRAVYLPEPGDGAPLTHLERCFLGEAIRWEGDAPAIRLREAGDLFAEVEQAAADIRRLAAAGKCRYREITVAAGRMGDYESAIESVFARYGIPVYLSRRSDILETPALTLVTAALAAVTEGFEYEDLFRYFKTGLAGLSPDECDRLENYALAWDLHGGMWLKETEWTANPDGYGAAWGEAQERALAELNGLRDRVRAPLKQLSDGLKAAETAGGKVDALYSFLETLRLQDTLTEQMERLQSAGELQRSAETAQLWEVLCAVLDQFVEILGEEPLSTDEFVRLLRQVLTQYSVGTIPASLDQVLVSQIDRNDRHTVRHLFLLGANDHVLPAVGTGGGILNDDDREELAERGIRLAPRGIEGLSLEVQNLYAALAQPTEGLTVSYPLSDVSGTELRPAFVIERIQTLFPSVRVERAGAEKEYRLTAKTPALELAGRRRGGALWAYFAGREDCRAALSAMERAAAMGRGRLAPPTVRALYGERMALSASRIERLNTCHFAYFMEYGLRARERGTASFAAPQIGTFLHYILENVTRDAMARGGFSQVDDQALRALTDRYIEQYAALEFRNFQDRSPRFRYLFNRLRGAACAVVRETAQELRVSDFVPLEFELGFGDRAALPAVRLSAPDGEVRVSGKVDRVDGWVKDGKLYLRVVDYKTGKKSFDLSEVRMGLDIQMLLYLFTLQKEGREHFGYDIEPAGVLYLPARDDLLSVRRSVTPEQLLALRAKSLQRSGLLLNDREVLAAMEHAALTEPQYLPLRLNRAGDITDGVASAAQLGALSRYVEKLLLRITREMRIGNIDADPCCRSEADSRCQYCQWAEACHFQDGRDGDHLRYIRPVKPADFWQQIQNETEGGERDG